MSYKAKAIIIILIAIIFFGLGILVSYLYIQNTQKPDVDNEPINYATEDNLKFKNEYESLNSNQNDNDLYLDISIPETNHIKYTSVSEIEQILNNNESAILYFGFESCQWCRNFVPVLIDASIQNNVDTIYYMNIKDMRDTKTLDENNNVYTSNPGTEEYQKLIEIFLDSLDVYEGLNDESIKRIYAPTLLFIKNGKVIAKHVGTVSSQEDPKIGLTDEQRNELLSIITENIKKVQSDICDEDNKNC